LNFSVLQQCWYDLENVLPQMGVLQSCWKNFFILAINFSEHPIDEFIQNFKKSFFPLKIHNSNILRKSKYSRLYICYEDQEGTW
ncbi:hypothetical protein, partial [Acinetobacter baumannii]|uniref:hypothetical protein n=1 Tax=Acinetobacter baumannii TaxID=470 RepID=UPI001C07721C